MIAEKKSTTLSIDHKNLYDRIIEMKRNMHRLEQYLRRECNFKKYNNLLEEHVILISEKLGVVMKAMEIVACRQLGKTGMVIVKLLNRKHTQNVMEEKTKLRGINIYDDDITGSNGSNNKRKSLCAYYRKLYDMGKDLNNEGLINYFWIANGTIKIRESNRSKPILTTHESDLQF